MAYGVEFRTGPGTGLTLDVANRRPSFPAPFGAKMHTTTSAKRQLSITNRHYPTTSIKWTVNNIKKTERDLFWTFWHTTIDHGYDEFTIIDHRSRYLFDASWNNWSEKWSKRAGGLYGLNIPITSPVSWSPPAWGLYPSTTATLDNHNKSGDDLTVIDGTMTTNGSDASVLRETGAALKVSEGAGPLTGATSTELSWHSGNSGGSVSMFCQFMHSESPSNIIYLCRLQGEGDSVGIVVDTSGNLYGLVNVDGTNNIIYKAGGTYPTTANDIWYDACITYDFENDRYSVYYGVSGTGSTYARFLNGETDIENGLMSTESNHVSLPRNTWTTATLIEESVNGAINGNVYVQNSWFIDGFVSATQFEQLRRIAYMWNEKTTGNNPA